ncbi:MAG: ATP-binding cassette domain-containing protein, partial [Stackebrandtia sp.]
PESGLVVPAGRLLVVAADDPAEAAAMVDRLGRHVDSEASYGNVRLSDMALSEVRRRILVADNNAFLFAGRVGEIVSAASDPDPEAAATAIHVAAADDVVAGLPDELDAELDTQARTLSGGQRQRLRLARAVLADPEVLILVEPTSAVDAHTEAAVADRLRRSRAGKTTVVVTASPLFLDRADQVVFHADGKVVAVGGHRDLLDESPQYRALVSRSTGEEQ